MAGDPEVSAMGLVLDALEPLSPEGRLRVMKFINERFGILELAAAARVHDLQVSRMASSSAAPHAPVAANQEQVQFRDFADLFDAADPKSDVDKALVAGWWVQFGEGNESFGSQALNDALKQLGHPIGNITRALGGLIDARPALVQQLGKDGSTKQARKTYRLTKAGEKRVNAMINSPDTQDAA